MGSLFDTGLYVHTPTYLVPTTADVISPWPFNKQKMLWLGGWGGGGYWGLEGINSLASYLVPTYYFNSKLYGLVCYAKVWH
jgi:hypothetical protein